MNNNFDSLTSIQIDILENRISDQPKRPFGYSFGALYGSLEISKYSVEEVQNALNDLVDRDFITKNNDIYIFSRDQFLKARSYFQIKNKPKMNKKSVAKTNDSMPEKITLAWLFHNVPYKFWLWLVGLLFTAFIAGVQSTKLTLVQELFDFQRAASNVSARTDDQTTQMVNDFQISLVVLELGRKGTTFFSKKIESVKLSQILNFVQLYQRINNVIESVSDVQFPYNIINYDSKKWINDFDAPVAQMVKNKARIIFVSKAAIDDYGKDIDLYLTAAGTLF